MALDDMMESEVGLAVVATAAAISPRARNILRRGAVYGLAGALKAGDVVVGAARGVVRGAADGASGNASPAAQPRSTRSTSRSTRSTSRGTRSTSSSKRAGNG